MTTEKLSQVYFMKNVGEGKDKYYHLAVDYRSFNNRWHISRPLFDNIHYFLNLSKSNFGNLDKFMMRSNSIVYIQRVSYDYRQYLVKEMMKYYPIDSYGNDLNNHVWPKNISTKNKKELLKKYKFCLAIENSVILWKKGTKFEATEVNNDYITEKLIDCLNTGCIPIYFGPRNVNEFLPHPDSIINLSSFSSIQNLTSYIKRINNNITLLKNYFSWHYNYSKEWFNKYKESRNLYCRICNYVKQYSKSKTKL